MIWLVFIICCYSMSSIIVEQKIFAEVREAVFACHSQHPNFFLKKLCGLLSCMWCTGTWSGFILCFMGLNPININYFDFFFCGLIAGFTTYMISLAMQRLDIYLKELGIHT
jgi:hypothetical protein